MFNGDVRSAKGSNRILGAVLLGAGPDDAHTYTDGFYNPVGGGYVIGGSNRYVIRFQNGRAYYLDAYDPDGLWFSSFTYFGTYTLAWWYANTNA